MLLEKIVSRIYFMQSCHKLSICKKCIIFFGALFVFFFN